MEHLSHGSHLVGICIHGGLGNFTIYICGYGNLQCYQNSKDFGDDVLYRLVSMENANLSVPIKILRIEIQHDLWGLSRLGNSVDVLSQGLLLSKYFSVLNLVAESVVRTGLWALVEPNARAGIHSDLLLH